LTTTGQSGQTVKELRELLMSRLMLHGLRLLIFSANTLYFVMKLLPIREQVVFISRQSNQPPEDFVSLAATIGARAGGPRSIILARTIEPGFVAGAKYAAHFIRQMWHLATSRYVVLDSYCIAVSILRHRQSLRVVQIWHALGAVKKFGLSAVDGADEYRQRIAKLFRMHNGYDTVVVSSAEAIGPFSQAMGVRPDQVEVCPLPRVDELTDPNWLADTRRAILETHPHLRGVKIALWAPTLSSEKIEQADRDRIHRLRNALAGVGYELIEMPHPLNISVFDNHESQISTHQWLAASDVFITDQSSLLVDAALLGLELYVYADDHRLEQICASSFLDTEILRALACSDPGDIARRIDQRTGAAMSDTLKNMFVELPTEVSCSEKLVSIILR
jgi:CDP-glycerol glycerophosphotransferase (TagB/SpsB family)